jgi:hypothetical protein
MKSQIDFVDSLPTSPFVTVPNNETIIQAVAAKPKNINIIRRQQRSDIFLFIKVTIFSQILFSST